MSNQGDLFQKPITAKGGGFKLERKPFGEAYEFATRMREMLIIASGVQLSGQDIHFCGSLRRQKETVGDLDIVWVGMDGDGKNIYQKFLNQLENNGYKYQVRQLGDCFLSVQVDDFLVEFKRADRHNVGAFILFATGPGQYNVEMRTYALSKGYHLSQYGLAKKKPGPKKKSDYKLGESEEEIYGFLGLSYEKPEDRVKFIAPSQYTEEIAPLYPKHIWEALPKEVQQELENYTLPRVDTEGILIPEDFLWNKQARHEYYRSRGVFKIPDHLKLDRYQKVL